MDGRFATPLDTNETIDYYEELRRRRSAAQFLRNQVYWRELRRLQREGLEDAGRLYEFMAARIARLKKIEELWAVGSSKGEESPRQTSHNNIGGLAVKALEGMETSCLKAFTDKAAALENDVLSSYRKKMTRYEKDVAVLWEKGKALLIAWKMLDLRLGRYHRALMQLADNDGNSNKLSIVTATSPSSGGHSAAQTRLDRCLLTLKYYVGLARFAQLMSHCNLQFRALYLIAKDLEATRVAMVARAGGTRDIFSSPRRALCRPLTCFIFINLFTCPKLLRWTRSSRIVWGKPVGGY